MRLLRGLRPPQAGPVEWTHWEVRSVKPEHPSAYFDKRNLSSLEAHDEMAKLSRIYTCNVFILRHRSRRATVKQRLARFTAIGKLGLI